MVTNKCIIFLLILSMFFIPSIFAASESTLGIFEVSTDIELLQICSNETALCDICNISSIKYPNSSILLSNLEMTRRVADFNYTINSTYISKIGTYTVNGFCEAGNELKVFSYVFEVTVNGNEKPTGIVIVFFTFLFTICVASLLALLLYNIFRFIEWNFDASDLIFNVSAYFINGSVTFFMFSRPVVGPIKYP